MWGEYVRQLIRQLIRVVSCLCRRERTSSGTGQPALGREGCCLGESPFFWIGWSGEYVFHSSEKNWLHFIIILILNK